MNLYERALVFAAKAHEMRPKKDSNRLRKYTFEPYIVHPISVAARLREYYPDDERMLAAALLHDVLEDTETEYSDLFFEFGPTVANMVDGLTDVSKGSSEKRAIRKAMDRDHLAEQDYKVQTIKIFDLIDNTVSIVQDKKFAKIYLAEKAELLKVLTKVDPKIMKLAEDSLKEAICKVYEEDGDGLVDEK